MWAPASTKHVTHHPTCPHAFDCVTERLGKGGGGGSHQIWGGRQSAQYADSLSRWQTVAPCPRGPSAVHTCANGLTRQS